MPIPQFRFNRKSFAVSAIITSLVVWFIVSFWSDVVVVLQLLVNTGKLALGMEATSISAEALHSLSVIVFNLIFGFGLMTLLWLLLTASQALLPTANIQEKYRTAWHLVLHLLGQHGPAIFIKNGDEISSAMDKRRIGPGVVVIDFNSAIVLEQLVPPPSLSRPFHMLLQKLLELIGLSDSYQPNSVEGQSTQRACGPGVVFTHSRERIRGTIDLRNQSRFTANIRAYTSDGIELSTGIWSLFSAGQKPETLQVIYQGDRHPDNLKVVNTRIYSDGRVKISTLPDHELDNIDRQAIFKATSRGISRSSFARPETADLLPQYDAERVFAAISSKAYNAPGGQVEWDRLPAQVAVDLFREILLQINYDRLYTPDENGIYLIPELKQRFNNAVRNMGLLSYQMIFLKNSGSGQYLADGVYHSDDLMVSPVIPLPNHEQKILRERGIKVIASGFLDLVPISDAIYKQRLDNWRAYWEKDTVVARARFDLDVMRTRKEAYTQAIGELEEEFATIIQRDASQYSQEALTMRIFQALDSVAADPKTRQLLPAESLNLLKSLHTWLLPDEKNPPAILSQFDSEN